MDCILWGGVTIVAENPSVTYCCVEGGYPGEGNIDADPMFSMSMTDWEWCRHYLSPDSPCIDTGSRTAEQAGLEAWTTQADGTPDTGRVDMGAHYPVTE